MKRINEDIAIYKSMKNISIEKLLSLSFLLKIQSMSVQTNYFKSNLNERKKLLERSELLPKKCKRILIKMLRHLIIIIIRRYLIRN